MAVDRFPVDAGHIMMFARSIADPNPVYYDAAYAATTELGAIPAPPTFVQASAQFDPNYYLRPQIGEPWFGSGAAPTGITRSGESSGEGGGGGDGVRSGLHAEQHFEYHRPLLAGDVLIATVHPGRRWDKEGRRGGTLRFSESITEYRNQDGDLVVTARAVGVQTGKVVERSAEGNG